MHVLISALHRPCKPTGVCRHAANLARCLAASSEITQVTIAIGAWQHDYFTTVFDLRSPKIVVTSVDIANSSVSRNLWFLWGLPKLARQLRPDLVHLSFPLPFERSRFTCPVVATIHDLYPYEYPENFGRIQATCNRLLLRKCIQQSDGVSCVSQTTMDRLEYFLPNRPANQTAAVVYNIVDFDRIAPTVPDFFRDRERAPFILSVGQHRKNKNLDLLIDAYDLLLDKQQIDPNIDLVIVGSHGPETANLRQQIQDLQLETKVQLLSAIDDPQLIWLYQHSQAVILPSSIEGFCLPLAEALHLSCQVVCSDIPIFREIGAGACGYFDFNGDPRSNLARSIHAIVHNPPAATTDRSPSPFSSTVISHQYLHFYQNILKTIPKSPVLV
jgi:glycosyltransferase involved in cell wall biosynthesis